VNAARDVGSKRASAGSTCRPRARVAWLGLLALAAAGGGDWRAAAASYFVDGAAGDDGNPGTAKDKAFQSLQRGVRDLRPGDDLTVGEGTYYELLAIGVSGTSDHPIVIAGQPGARPLIKYAGDAITITGSYVELRGFEASSLAEGAAIAIGKGNHHVSIIDNIARDSGCAGIGAQQTDYITIERNVVHGNSMRSPWQCSGISLYQAKNVDTAPGFHNFIRRNLSYSNMNIIVDEKISKSNGKTTDGNGIIIDDFRQTQYGTGIPPYTGRTLIENNVVFDNGGRGIQIFLSDDVVIRNNTVFQDLKDTNLIGPYNGELSAISSRGVSFLNNLVVGRAGANYAFVDGSSADNLWDFNLVFGTRGLRAEKSNAIQGEHNLLDVDPKFVNASLDPAHADFHLRPGSPALNAGSAAAAPADDFDGKPRPVGRNPAIGAFEAAP
jgi:prepilin-type processing-associated H-X9-DG protein